MESRFDGARGWCIVGAIALAHVLLAGYGAVVHFPVMDEVAHLPAGISHWRFGHFDLYKVDPPLVRMLAALPVLAVGADEDWTNIAEEGVHWKRPEFLVGFDFARRNGNRLLFLVQIARLAVVPLSVLALVVCYVWARALYGPVPGLVSAALWAFCPNVLAFAPVITPDVGGAAFGVLAVFLAWRWSQSRTWPRALAAGTSLGLALLSRSVWLILFVILPLLWCLDKQKQERTLASQCVQSVAILLLGLAVLNAGYGFERPLASLASFEFTSDLLTGEENAEAGRRAPNNVFKSSILGGSVENSLLALTC